MKAGNDVNEEEGEEKKLILAPVLESVKVPAKD